MSDMTRANGFLSLCQGQPELVPTKLGTLEYRIQDRGRLFKFGPKDDWD